MGNEQLKEKLADLCHDQWAGWMRYMFSKAPLNDDGTWTMPSSLVERWQRQMSTPYSELSGPEQDSDRNEAAKFIEVIYSQPNINIWRWQDAPQEYMELSGHGGDEDWVVYAPVELVGQYLPLELEEVIGGSEDSYVYHYGHVDRHVLDNGDVVVIFAHA